MIIEGLRNKILLEGYKNSKFYEIPSFDKSIVGVAGSRVVYLFDDMVEEFVEDSYTEEERATWDDDRLCEARTEAIEFIEYNTLRATPYVENELGPIVIDMNPEDEKFHVISSSEDRVFDLDDIEFSVKSKDEILEAQEYKM